jgi:predicted HicB family RNase H-like nuclease
MKGVSTRIEEELHRRLRMVVLLKNTSVQNFVFELLKSGIDNAENELKAQEAAHENTDR